MKLISMTDYVLEQEKKEEHVNGFYNIIDYAKFLKLPLKLGMFVPCDENDVPLDEPTPETSENTIHYELRMMEYKQAKERVIFEGFEKYSPQLLCEMFNTIEEITKLDITLTDSAIKKYNL